MRDGFEAALRPYLLVRAARDYRARHRFEQAGASRAADRAYDAVLAVDEENRVWLERVLRSLGRWPWRSRVGEDGADAAWLIAQHASEDRAFQERCLSLHGDAVALGEASPQRWAMLSDRIAVCRWQPQRFATQSVLLPGGERRLWPVRDMSSVDAARAEVGLPPLDRSLDELAGIALAPPGEC